MSTHHLLSDSREDDKTRQISRVIRRAERAARKKNKTDPSISDISTETIESRQSATSRRSAESSNIRRRRDVSDLLELAQTGQDERQDQSEERSRAMPQRQKLFEEPQREIVQEPFQQRQQDEGSLNRERVATETGQSVKTERRELRERFQLQSERQNDSKLVEAERRKLVEKAEGETKRHKDMDAVSDQQTKTQQQRLHHQVPEEETPAHFPKDPSQTHSIRSIKTLSQLLKEFLNAYIIPLISSIWTRLVQATYDVIKVAHFIYSCTPSFLTRLFSCILLFVMLLAGILHVARGAWCNHTISSWVTTSLCAVRGGPVKFHLNGYSKSDSLDGLHPKVPALWRFLDDNLIDLKKRLHKLNGQGKAFDNSILLVVEFEDVYSQATRNGEALEAEFIDLHRSLWSTIHQYILKLPEESSKQSWLWSWLGFPHWSLFRQANTANKELLQILNSARDSLSKFKEAKLPPDPSDGVLGVLFSSEMHDLRNSLDSLLRVLPESSSEGLSAAATMWSVGRDTMGRLVADQGVMVIKDIEWLDEKIQKLAADGDLLGSWGRGEKWERKMVGVVKRAWRVAFEWRRMVKGPFVREKMG